MSKHLKRIAFLVIFTLVAPAIISFIPSVPSLTAKEVSAATLESTPITVGINSSGEYVNLLNQNKSATYTYESADESIAKVTEYGWLVAVSKGSTTITVKETVNGVTTELGKVKVNVTGPQLAENMTVGLGSSETIPLNYTNWDAKYTVKSSNTKIVKVNKYNEAIGVKYGTAKLTVTEKCKGIKTKIGVITVKVAKASITDQELSIGVNSGDTSISIDDRNAKAIYKFKAADKKIVKLSKDGYLTGLKRGSTTVKVTETNKKKTRTLGTVTVKVVGASIDPAYNSITISLNQTSSVEGLMNIRNQNFDATYTCQSSDNNIVYAGNIENEDGDSYFRIKGASSGTATLTVYEEYNGDKEKIGTVTANVIVVPITNLTLQMYDDDDNLTTKKEYIEGERSYHSVSDYVEKEPYNASDEFTYSSSNEKIAAVDKNGYVTGVSEGSATITITCGKFSVSYTAVVTSIKVENFQLDEEYFDDEDGKLTKTFILGLDEDMSVKDYLIIEPEDATTPITYSSSNEKVAKIDLNGELTFVGKGNAVITMKCGKFTVSFTAVVVSDDEEDY